MACLPARARAGGGVNLVRCEGGVLERPTLVLNDRADGGHLVVHPPRPVWDRTALSHGELAAFSYLVAAAAKAMLHVLPQLDGGCINYWDAGNWALNVDAPPTGPKRGEDARQLHLHLFGRSREARNPDWLWGEGPRFPRFADRLTWAADKKPLTREECRDVAGHCFEVLAARYSITGELLAD